MVHPAFDISKESLAEAPENCQLLIEISAQAFNYILFTRNPDQLFLLRQYRIYTSADKTNRDVLEEIISGDPVLARFAEKATIVYNFPEASIVPASLFHANLKNPVASLVYGNTDHHFVFDEKVNDSELHNVYIVPKDLHLLCRDKFKDSQYLHLYTVLLRWAALEEKRTGDYIRVIFYNDKFIVAVFREGKLFLMQTFAYQTPEDAAYYLLLICKQFSIDHHALNLGISGLIDEQSALYTELLKYFVNVNHEGIPDTFGTNSLLDEYPSHYFSPLLKMSLCV